MSERVIDIRQDIYLRLGANGDPNSGLTREELNSLHRYLTGEFAVEPHLAGTGPGFYKRDVMEAVASEMGFGDWFDHLDRSGNVRLFRKNELANILVRMESVEDQRPDAGDPVTL
jgi:hypothetical protein